jgi:sugar phosphate isomerase/epimerase
VSTETSFTETTATREREWIHPIGLQLYTVREELHKNFEGTLSQIAKIGYREVEIAGLLGQSALDVGAILRRVGLQAPSGTRRFADLDSDLSRVLDDALTLGQQYIVLPEVPAQLQSQPTLDGYRRLADRLNPIAESIARAGLTLAYHNENTDFVAIDGQLPYDVLLEAMDPKLIKLEIDLYWMIHAGQDPLKYFARWPGRIPLVHVKDGHPPPIDGMADVGSGTIDWPRIFAQHRQAGIEHYIVERDDSPNGLLTAAKSFKYLSSLSRE